MNPSSMIQNIPIKSIRPNPKQPRKRFAGIEELSESIKEKGLLEPIMVRPVSGGQFEIVHGERRWRASKLAGLESIDCVVREVSDKEAFELALIENVQRQDLSPMEEAAALKILVDQGMTQTTAARLIGKTQSYVAHKLELLRLPEPITFYLSEGALTENHVRQLAKLKGIYPEETVFRFNPEWLSGEDVGLSPVSAGITLFHLSPEDYPPCGVFQANPVIIAGLINLRNYVSKHNHVTPQWIVSGFYWGSVAVRAELSVAKLTRVIELWRERYESALVWLYLHDTLYPPKPTPKAEKTPLDLYSLRWWGYSSDLRHSNSIEYENDKQSGALKAVVPIKLRWAEYTDEASYRNDPFVRCFRLGRAEPTELQEWHPSYKQRKDEIVGLLEQERIAQAREGAEWIDAPKYPSIDEEED